MSCFIIYQKGCSPWTVGRCLIITKNKLKINNWVCFLNNCLRLNIRHQIKIQ